MTTEHDDVPGRSPRPPHEDALVGHLYFLGTQLAASPTEEYRVATRARLVAMAAVRQPAAGSPGAVRSPVPSSLRRLLAGGAPRWRSRVTTGVAGTALTVSALGGLLAVSQGTTPGDLLYGVKRGGEQTQLALAGDATRGRTLLEFASTRLTELTALTRATATALPPTAPGPAGTTTILAAGPDADVVVDTLDTMDRQTTRGTWEVTTRSVANGDPRPLVDLAMWAAGQESGLVGLTGAVPEPAGPALTGSTDLATAVADRATALVAALGCTAGPATTGADDLGPLPVPCSPDSTRAATRDEADGGADAGVAAGRVAAGPSAGASDAGTAEPGPSPASGTTPSVPAGTTEVVVPPATTGAPGGDGGTGGRTPSSPSAGMGRGGLPVPLPTLPRAGTPAPAPVRPSTPPVIDLPVPLCVTTLGLPILC
jgi:hypothetical protein